MRGRLISPVLARIHLMDPSPAGNPAPGVEYYDPILREPALVDTDGNGIDDRERPELQSFLLECQVEPAKLDALHMRPSGNDADSAISLVFHFRELEERGVVSSVDGGAIIRTTARLSELLTKRGERIQLISPPGGLYATESRPIGIGLGLGTGTRNLLMVTFMSRSDGFG